MPRVSPTPLRLAKLTLLGSVLVMVGYAAMFLPFPPALRHHGFITMLWSERLGLLCAVLPMLAGMGVLFYSSYRLSRGINRLRFSDEELEEARRFVFLPWLTYVQLAGLAMIVVLGVIQITSHRFAGNSPVILLLATNPLNYVRSNLGKATVKPSAIDWHLAQPIHSEHWGETT